MPLAILPLLLLTLSAGPDLRPDGRTVTCRRTGSVFTTRTGGTSRYSTRARIVRRWTVLDESGEGVPARVRHRHVRREGARLSDPPTPSDAPDVQVEDLVGLIKERKLEQADSDGALYGQRIGGPVCAASTPTCRGRYSRGFGAGPAGCTGGHPNHSRADAARIFSPATVEREALVEGSMKNSPKWGRSECEVWASSKDDAITARPRHHHRSRPPMSELFGRSSHRR